MKILGCDYDGTLNYGGFDEKKMSAIGLWRAQGNKIGVVSGRSFDMLSVIEKECGIPLDFFVAFNGAIVYNAESGELDKTPCEEVNPADLVKDLFAFGCTHAHVNSDKYYLVRENESERKDGEYTLQDVTFPTLIYQVSVELPSETESACVAAKVEEKYGHVLSPLQNGRCVDIVAKGVGKAYGLKKVQGQFNAKWEDVIAVGDNLNDVDMLQAFPSYAMENGVEEVKKIAVHITKSVTDVIYRELNVEKE